MKFHSPREWSSCLITAPQKRAIGADFAAGKRALDDLSRLSGSTNKNKTRLNQRQDIHQLVQSTDAKVYSCSHVWGAGHSLYLSTLVWNQTRQWTANTHQTKQAARKEEAQGGKVEEDRGEHWQHGTRRSTHAALAATEVVTWGQA